MQRKVVGVDRSSISYLWSVQIRKNVILKPVIVLLCIACQMSRNGENADKREIEKRNGEEQETVYQILTLSPEILHTYICWLPNPNLFDCGKFSKRCELKGHGSFIVEWGYVWLPSNMTLILKSRRRLNLIFASSLSSSLALVIQPFIESFNVSSKL